ncbi:MAG: hypothetical protein NWE91_01485 [Candidatus Bathyarchaeota archaeon]|nr:hypothetical protein [Candidatus Bathyarchaeota archaeon]
MTISKKGCEKMGIYITISRLQQAFFRGAPDIRLDYCIEAIRFFEDGLFTLENAEIWFDAPSESQGGHIHKHIDSTNFYTTGQAVDKLLSELSFENIIRTIILFNGTWDFNGVELGGYFSIHNNSDWRKVYRDIEIDAYGKGDFVDLVDVLWKAHDMTTLVPKFARALEKSSPAKRKRIYEILFSQGVPTDDDVSNIRATLFRGRAHLIRFFYRVLRNSKDIWVNSRATPIDNRFFIKTLYDETLVQKRLTNSIKEALLVEKEGSSVTYVGKEADSFARLYKSFVDSVLKPALKEMPPEELVKQAIERGLREYPKETVK